MPDSPSLRKKVYTGAHGNQSAEQFYAVAAAAAVNSVFNIGTLPAGVIVDEIRVCHDNLGASVTLDVGVAYPNGEAADAPTRFLAAQAVSAVGIKSWADKPVRFDADTVLTLTTKGAVATGRVDVLVRYRYIGNLVA